MYEFQYRDEYHKHVITKQKKTLENSEAKILWDISIETVTNLKYNKPDVILLEKRARFASW